MRRSARRSACGPTASTAPLQNLTKSCTGATITRSSSRICRTGSCGSGAMTSYTTPPANPHWKRRLSFRSIQSRNWNRWAHRNQWNIYGLGYIRTQAGNHVQQGFTACGSTMRISPARFHNNYYNTVDNIIYRMVKCITMNAEGDDYAADICQWS